MEKFLCLDSGTTNTKVFLFSENGKLLRRVSVKTGISFPEPLFAEQNCYDWITAIKTGITRIGMNSSISGISGSFQGGTFVLLDKNLQPLRPAITWLDNRAKIVAEKLVKEFGKDFFYTRTGYVPGGWSCVAILKWLKENEPEIFKKIARISFVADYINYFLAGNFTMDYTSAAITTLYNIRKGQWDDDLLNLAGVKRQMLPDLTQANMPIGVLKRDVSRLTGLKSGIPILAGGHDQYCASFGAGASEKGEALVSCGTAWVLLVTTGKLVFDPERQLAPGPHLCSGMYGLMAAMSNGGVIYSWGKQNLIQKPVTFKKPSGIIVIPEFNTGNGMIYGLSLSTKSSELLKAIVESLCFQVREKLEKVENVLPEKEKINKIIMIGGAARDFSLAKLIATVCEKPVFVPEIKESAGLGAMRLFVSPSKFNKIQGRLFNPQKCLTPLYLQLYGRYLKLKDKLKKENFY
ncbi:MAG: FGGY-family carbohydrate kinase [bacterium]|nr:FGGY-family carbohydrate kinase [bacterium]